MKNLQLNISNWNRMIITFLFFFAAILAAGLAFGHGGKHADKFTQLQALQKATKLYEQLIVKGKLDQSWELGLRNVAISKRKHEGKDEIVVGTK